MKTCIQFLILFSYIWILSSCTPVCRFGMTQKYNLEPGEKAQQLEQYLVDKYEQRFNKDSLNVPLTKIITAQDYRVYVGVLLSGSPDGLISAYRADTSICLLSEKNENSTLSFMAKIAGEYYYSFLYDSEKDKLSYLLVIEGDSAAIAEKYNQNVLKAKVLHE